MSPNGKPRAACVYGVLGCGDEDAAMKMHMEDRMIEGKGRKPCDCDGV